MKVYEIELKAAYTHIRNSAQAKRAGTSVDGNPMPTVPSKIAKSAKPGCPKAAHRIEDERLYKSLNLFLTEQPTSQSFDFGKIGEVQGETISNQNH